MEQFTLIYAQRYERRFTVFKYFLVAVFLISQLLCIPNSNAGSVKSMTLLNDNQLSTIDAKGVATKNFTKVKPQYVSKIILWDEQVSYNSDQIQINSGFNGNYASSINNIGLAP